MYKKFYTEKENRCFYEKYLASVRSIVTRACTEYYKKVTTLQFCMCTLSIIVNRNVFSTAFG